jgi:DNA-binding transcriptional ArsR family regulator
VSPAPQPPHATERLNRVFQALADPTRRAVLERLGRGSAGMSELAEPFGMALPSFAQHLRVLEDCGLVNSAKQGRVRTYALAPGALAPAEHWLEKHRRLWETRLDQLDAFLLELNRDKRRSKR